MKQFIFPLRVYIEDTDYAGIVYHSNYLNYFERARSEWAEKVGLGIICQQAEQLLFPVRHAKLDYLKPAKLHQLVEVVSEIKELRKASLVYDQYLRLAGTDDTIFCKAEVKIVCVGMDFKPKAIPENMVEKLKLHA